MQYKKAELKPDELATLELRGLYEQFGYKKYKMSKFEEYSLYVQNKDFLGSDKVITFTDLDGRLLALKPDVTLSIIKNAKADGLENEKLYYIENVYRESKESHTYKEINQMGLEYIGDVDTYAIVEIVGLAARSLKAINPDYILELSHMSFVVELLDSLKTTLEIKHKLLRLIRAKNTDGIRRTAQNACLSTVQTESLCRIPTLYGDAVETIREAAKLAINKGMETALKELGEVCRALRATGLGKNIQLDFSMVNDIDYYNGIILKGYINGLARSVLAGGQYDKALAMFGKNAGAMGFAIYLNEINRLPLTRSMPDYDVDAVLLYDITVSSEQVAQEIQKLQEEGLSVRAEKTLPEKLRYREVYSFDNGRLVCIKPDADKMDSVKDADAETESTDVAKIGQEEAATC